MDCVTFSRVVLMGFAVANPGYSTRFTLTPADACRLGRFDGSLEIGFGPRAAGTWPYDGPMALTEFRQDASGELRLPRPAPWYLTEVLAASGSPDAPSGNRRTADLLKGMAWPGHRVHAVVELARPLPEKQAGELHHIGKGEVLLLSPGHGGDPIGWPWVFPGVIGAFDAYGDVGPSRVAEFRRWVSLLRAEDRPALREVGLDLAELRGRAAEGLVHGFTIISSPETVRHLAGHPLVRSVQVIEIVPGSATR